MALKLNLDSIDSLSDAEKGFYKEVDGKFILDVDGIEDTTALKSALQKERDSGKGNKAKIAELEKLAKDAETAALEEQGNYKELSEQNHKDKLASQAELSELKTKIAEASASALASDIASRLTTDAREQKIIARFASDFITIDGDQATFNKEVKDVESDLSQYVLSKASGTNDGGSAKVTTTVGNLGGTRQERIQAIQAKIDKEK